ncbi:MAG: SufD family Fe-S cluster assembly protein [Ruminiclostridium sp.]|nr:SufD family Fe-S cluster assembly protein [Ruminiclostridium sp.]
MTKLNILPLPTFARLGVNYAEREIGEFEREEITVPEGAEQQIIQFVSTCSETVVNVGKNAALKLVMVFSDKQACAAKLVTTLDDSAKLELIQLYLGGDTVSEIITELKGYKAEFSAEIGYDLGAGDILDINLVANHHGRKSTSEIAVNGVLRDNAQKTFKGTIDFRNGSAGAKGSEKEDVILMSEAVVNKTVPVILCDEEDVEGSHGATIGRIDEGHIYYMRSRGIPEEKIYELITRARLSKIIGKIGDEQAEKRIYTILGWSDDIE